MQTCTGHEQLPSLPLPLALSLSHAHAHAHAHAHTVRSRRAATSSLRRSFSSRRARVRIVAALLVLVSSCARASCATRISCDQHGIGAQVSMIKICSSVDIPAKVWGGKEGRGGVKGLDACTCANLGGGFASHFCNMPQRCKHKNVHSHMYMTPWRTMLPAHVLMVGPCAFMQHAHAVDMQLWCPHIQICAACAEALDMHPWCFHVHLCSMCVCMYPGWHLYMCLQSRCGACTSHGVFICL